MLLKQTSTFNIDIDTAWHYLQKPALLNYIASPVQQFKPIEPKQFPAEFSEGKYKVQLVSFGLVPMGEHSIVLQIPPTLTADYKSVQDNGSGTLIKKWNHTIEMRRSGNQTVYTDTVDIDAGIMTPFIWLHANLFFMWRQHRWKQLIKGSFKQLEG